MVQRITALERAASMRNPALPASLPIAIGEGGTGAITVADALANLGIEEWQTYSPTLGVWTLGTTGSSRSHEYMRIGKTVWVKDYITFGTGATFGIATPSGPTLTLPTAAEDGSSGLMFMEGVVSLTLTSSLYLVKWRSTGGSGMIAQPVIGNGGAASQWTQVSNFTNAAPVTWAAGTVLRRCGFYVEN